MDSTLLIVIIIIGIFLIPSLRSGKSALKHKPKQLIAFATPRPVEEVAEIVQEFARENAYKLEDVDLTAGRIILSDSASRNSWGFFYPVYISKQDEGGTLVEVGIKSRLVQIGRQVKTSHTKCAEALEKALE